ncbi:MAG: hypothetical protein GX219_04420 [Tissierellia bacterium]|nr:hypothetical protein [Tissierellia bacterium]
MNIEEARSELESLNLVFSEIEESPSISFANMKANKVTRLLLPNGKKIFNNTIKSDQKIWIYYLTQNVIDDSKAMEREKKKFKKTLFKKNLNRLNF